MSRISKKKFWETLKKEPEPDPSIFDMEFEDWVTGYKRFRKQQDAQNAMHEHILENTLSTPLSEYEAVEKIGKKRRKRKC